MHLLSLFIIVSLIAAVIFGVIYLLKEMDNYDFGVGGIGFWIAISLFAISGLMGIIGYSGYQACETNGRELGADFRWGHNAGCRIEIDGRFIPIENFVDLDSLKE